MGVGLTTSGKEYCCFTSKVLLYYIFFVDMFTYYSKKKSNEFLLETSPLNARLQR